MTSISPSRFVLVALAAGLTAGTAHADDAKPQPDTTESAAIAEARRLYVEGNEHYGAGRYTLAAEAFVKAYELSGKPALLFNLANTYERAGDYEKAARYLRMYIDGGDVHDPQAVRARLQRLELAVAELQERAEADKASAAVATPVAEPEAPPAPARRGPSRLPYYVAGGGLAAGAASALAFGLLARGERSDIASMCTEQDGGVLCPPEADAHLGRERRYALFSDVGLGVAAASVATGLVYYLVTRDRDEAPEPSRRGLTIVPSASADSLGLVAAGRF